VRITKHLMLDLPLTNINRSLLSSERRADPCASGFSLVEV